MVSRARPRNGTAPADAAPAQAPTLLRRLLRAKDRMDAASHEAWPVRRLAAVSGTSGEPPACMGIYCQNAN